MTIALHDESMSTTGLSNSEILKNTLDFPVELNTALDWIRWAATEFNRAGVFFGHGTENEWDEATSLVFQALLLPLNVSEVRYQQIVDAQLVASEKQVVFEWINKRVSEHLPLPYITQQAWFCEMPFYVDERVLIPRSPFAELIKARFDAWLPNEPELILDMCTGGGCISIALARYFDDAQIDAVDIDTDALAVAAFNINEYQLDHRVFPVQSDLFVSLEGQRYDLIVCNPPYVDAQDMDDLPNEFKHEPKHALEAGEDGLTLVADILKQAPEYMTDEAWLFVEVGNSEVHMEARFSGLKLQWCEFDHGGSGIFAISKQNLVAYWNQ